MTRRERRAAFIGNARNVRQLSRASVTLHIGELVLHGVKSSDRHRVADCMRAELESRLGSSTLPQRWNHTTSSKALNAGEVALHSASNPRTLGNAIARAVHGALLQ